MKIHEFQAKELLRRYNVPLLQGGAAKSANEAANVAGGIAAPLWIVKSQIHAGGRGMGRFKEEVSPLDIALAVQGRKANGKGGVRLAKTIDEVREHAAAMLGKTLVTKQTGAAGKVVSTV